MQHDNDPVFHRLDAVSANNKICNQILSFIYGNLLSNYFSHAFAHLKFGSSDTKVLHFILFNVCRCKYQKIKA